MEVSGKRADDVSEVCDICQSEQANGFCNDCKEYMCQGCFQDHKKAKPCRHHMLTPTDQATGHVPYKPYEEKCKVHTTENIRYYCRKHDFVGCGDCLVYQHCDCKAEVIKDLVINFEDCVEFKEMLSRIQKYSNENKENTKRLENNIKQNKAMIDKALDEIRKFRKEINDFIDQAEKTIVEQANKQSKNNETMFSQLEQKIAEVSKDIDEIREKLDTNLHEGEDLFIRMIECKSKETHVQQTVAEIKSGNILINYEFQPEQKLKHLLTSNIILGTITFSDGSEEKKNTSENTVSKMEQTSEPSTTASQPSAKTKYNPPECRAHTELVASGKIYHVTFRMSCTTELVASGKIYHVTLRMSCTHRISGFRKDPRSAGFDVGTRVKRHPFVYISFFRAAVMGTGEGNIVSVDPIGYVDVKWDQGSTCRMKAGAGEKYELKTLTPSKTYKS